MCCGQNLRGLKQLRFLSPQNCLEDQQVGLSSQGGHSGSKADGKLTLTCASMIAHQRERNMENQELTLQAPHQKWLKSLLFIFLVKEVISACLISQEVQSSWKEIETAKISSHRVFFFLTLTLLCISVFFSELCL